MAKTKFKDASFSDYVFHKKNPTVELGYNYYMFIHPRGQIIMMRENEAETEYLFADGGLNKTTAWSGRSGLDYKYYDELA